MIRVRIGVLVFCILQAYSVSGIEIEGVPISLEADHFLFDRSSQDIHASQNVILNYKNYKISAEHVSYIRGDRSLVLKDKVIIQDQTSTVSADRFEYDFALSSGNAVSVFASSNNTYFSFKRLFISQGKISLHNGSVTSCSLSHPHYEVRPQHATLYQRSGDVVAYNNLIYFYNIPLFYVPSLVYETKGLQHPLSKSNETSSLPQIGSNSIDGLYGSLYYPYFLSQGSTGGFTLKWAASRGLIYGFNHRYLFNQFHLLYFKALSVQETGFEGGAIYQWEFLSSTDSSSSNDGFSQLLSSFAPRDKRPHSTLSLFYLHHEIINYELVNFEPGVQVDFYNMLTPFDTSLTASLFGGQVQDSDADTEKYSLSYKVKREWEYPKTTYGIEWNQLYNHYGDQSYWNRVYTDFSISSPTNFFNPKLIYTKLLWLDGGSPFLFDSINSIESDELGLTLFFDLFNVEVNPEVHYNLFNHTFRDVVLNLGFPQHCWRLYVRWDVTWESVQLGASLLQ